MEMHLDLNDSRVIDELFNSNYIKFVFFATKLIKNKEDARDIVVDSFVKLLGHKSIKFENPTHLQTYFYSVIKNSCLDYLRKAKSTAILNDHLMQEVPLIEDVMEHKWQESELVQLIYERIEYLPERMRQVFKLIYLDGYSRAEVAQLLKLSENTIRNTNAAAMKAIRMTFLYG